MKPNVGIYFTGQSAIGPGPRIRYALHLLVLLIVCIGSESYADPPRNFYLNIEANEGGRATGTGFYEEATIVTIQAHPDYGYTFDYRTGYAQGGDSSFPITMDRNKSATAHFEPIIVHLAFNATNSGSVLGSGNYVRGTRVTVTAIPNPDYRFTHWSDDISVDTPVVEITMTANNKVTAHFDCIPPFTCTLTANATPGGTVTGRGTFEDGEFVTICATPDSGWSRDGAGIANPIGILMDVNKYTTASFERFFYTLTTSALNGGTVTPVGVFPHNTVVLVQGDPLPSHRFLRWTGHANGTSPTVNVLMNNNKSVSGVFAAKLDQQILFDVPGDHNADDEPLDPNVRATSDLPVTLKDIQGEVTLDGQEIILNGPTAVIIREEQPGNDTYNPAVPVSIEFNVITESRTRITKSSAEIKLLGSRSVIGTSSFLLGDYPTEYPC